MNDELQNLENRLGERLQAHYEAEYGEIRPASELWQRLAPVLASVDADDEQTSVHGTRKDVASVNTRKNASFDPPPEERVVDFAPRSRGRLAIFAGLAATIVLAVGIIALVLFTTSRPEDRSIPMPGAQPTITQSAKLPTQEGRPTMANAPTPVSSNTSANVQFPQVRNLQEIQIQDPHTYLFYFLREATPVIAQSYLTKYYKVASSASKDVLAELKSSLKSAGFTETLMFAGNPVPGQKVDSEQVESYHFKKGEQEYFAIVHLLPSDLNKLPDRVLSFSNGVNDESWKKFFDTAKGSYSNYLVTISAGKDYQVAYSDVKKFESLKTGATNLKVQPGWTEIEIDPQLHYFYNRSLTSLASDSRFGFFVTDEEFNVASKKAEAALLAEGYRVELRDLSSATDSQAVDIHYSKPGAPDIIMYARQITDKNRTSLFDSAGWTSVYREQALKLAATKATAIQVMQGRDLLSTVSKRSEPQVQVSPASSNAPVVTPPRAPVQFPLPPVKSLQEIPTQGSYPYVYYFLRDSVPVLVNSTDTKFYKLLLLSPTKDLLEEFRSRMKSEGYAETLMFAGNPPSVARTDSVRYEAYHFQKGAQEYFAIIHLLPQDLSKMPERVQANNGGVDPALWTKFFDDVKGTYGNYLISISAGKNYRAASNDLPKFESLKTGATRLKVQPGWTEVEIDPQLQYFYSRSMTPPASDGRVSIFVTDEDFKTAWKKADAVLLADGYIAESQGPAAVVHTQSAQSRYSKPGAPDIILTVTQFTDKDRKAFFDVPGWTGIYRQQAEQTIATKATGIQVIQANDLLVTLSSRLDPAPTASPNSPSNANQPVTVAPAPTPAPSDEKRENP